MSAVWIRENAGELGQGLIPMPEPLSTDPRTFFLDRNIYTIYIQDYGV
jgi:hypothetical protein